MAEPSIFAGANDTATAAAWCYGIVGRGPHNSGRIDGVGEHVHARWLRQITLSWM